MSKRRHKSEKSEVTQPLLHFHPFPKLPAELRRMIWVMAIYTDTDGTPKIHYYSFFNDDHEGYRQSFLPRLMFLYMNRPKPNWEPCALENRTLQKVIPPKLTSQPGQCWWTEANRLECYWNGGLQTACRESRIILLEHRLSERRVHTRKRKRASPQARNGSDIAIVRRKNEKVYVDFSRRDIVCLRFAPEDLAASVALQWDQLLVRLPFFQLPRDSGMNLAFEFEDSWNDGLGFDRKSLLNHFKEASPRGLVMRAYWAWSMGQIPRWTRMCLIQRGGKIPVGTQVTSRHDDRYLYESVYPWIPPDIRAVRGEDHTFIDDKSKYVERYTWDEYRVDLRRPSRGLPIFQFLWKVVRLCRPKDKELNHIVNRPRQTEYFLRVLRQLPETKQSR